MRLIAFIVAIGILFGAEARADSLEDCRDFDSCPARDYALTLATYDFEPLRERRAGPIIRVIFSDDYGRPMPAVELTPSGRGAKAKIVVPLWEGLRGDLKSFRRVVRTGAIDRAVADQLFLRARQVSGSPVEQPDDPEHANYICLHPRSARIEVLIDGHVAVRERENCFVDPVIELAFDVAKAAIASRPECAALNPERHGGMYQLETCGRLAGQLLSAAAAMNRARDSAFEEADAAGGLFDDRVIILWPDQGEIRGREAATRVWSEAHKSADYSLDPLSATGVGPGEARIGGRVYRVKDRQFGEAKFEQVWSAGSDGVWRLSRWTIQPFVVERDDAADDSDE